MGPDKLDDFIKKQVGTHETANDPDLLWQKILAKQEEEKKPKRRFFLFWWLGGASLLLGVILLYVFQFSNSDSHLSEHKQPRQAQQTVVTPALKETTTAEDETQKVESIARKKFSDNTKSGPDLNKEENENSPTSKESQVSLDTPPIIATNSSDKIKQTTDKITQTKINENSNTTSKAITSPTSLDLYPSGNTLAPDSEEQGKGSTPLLENNIPAPVTTEEVETKKEELKEEEKMEEAPSTNNPKDRLGSTEKESQAQTENKAVLPVPTIDSIAVEEQKASTDSLASQNPKQAKQKQWKFSNGVSFTYGKALRTLLDRTSAQLAYLESRKNRETPLDAVRFNLDFRAQHSSGFYLKSGLEYEQINERFDAYIEWDSMMVDPDQLLAIAYDKDGTVSERRGSGEVMSVHWLQKKIYNHYRSIDVPFLLGYHSKNEDKRLAWFVEAGASVNLWFAASGEILDTNDQYLSLAENTDLFKTQTGLSLIGAAGLTYRLANQFSIWASPEIKYHLNSISSEQNTIDQKYLNIGLRVGLRYHWKRKTAS